MLKGFDTFYTYVIIFLTLGLVVPLLIVLATIISSRTTSLEVNVVNPGLPDSNIQSNYSQTLQNASINKNESVNPNIAAGEGKNTKLHYITIRDGSVSDPIIDIARGETVVFNNESLLPIRVVGTNWGSGNFIEPKKSFAQTFNIRGGFEYTIVGTQAAYGKIQVK